VTVSDGGKPPNPVHVSPDGQWWWDGSAWIPAPPKKPPVNEPKPDPTADPRGSRPTRNQWVNITRLGGALLVAIGLTLFFLHPSVSFTGFNSQGAASARSGTCISPWNSWTEHFDHAQITTVQDEENQTLTDQQCTQAIQAREHWGWTLFALGVVGLAGSFLIERRTRRDGHHEGSQQTAAKWTTRPLPNLPPGRFLPGGIKHWE